AAGRVASTSNARLGQRRRGRRERGPGTGAEKMPERDPHRHGNKERPTWKRMHGLAKVIADRLIAGEQGPGLKGHQQKDRADECRHQERKEVPAIENHRRAAAPSTSAGTRWIAATNDAGASTP